MPKFSRIQWRSCAAAAILACSVVGADVAVATAAKPVVLEKGDRGKAVKRLQRALGLTPDGVYGPATRRAVRRFQRREGLTVDGKAGPATLAALGIGAHEAKAVTGTLPPLLQAIAECESGGNPAAVSPNGRYRGKYQFSRATWRALGGKGDPAKAPEAEQDRRARDLFAREGSKPWPSCARAAKA